MSDFLQRLEKIRARITTVEPQEARKLLGREDVCFVDLRDGYELEEYGMIPGAEHCPRGSLEFRIPADSDYHQSFFSQDKRFVFYCSHGQRSILATDTAQQLGLQNVCHIRGGMIGWVKAGGEVVKAEKRLS